MSCGVLIPVTCLSLSLLASSLAGKEQLVSHTLQVAGQSRTYHVHLPVSAPSKALPVVMVLHGGGGRGDGLRNTYGFKPLVAEGKCVAVYPDAIKGQWMPADEEVAFLEAVMDEVMGRDPVDAQRFYLTGASRGGIMTFYLLPRFKHEIRAAGTVIAGMLPFVSQDFVLKRPVDCMMINGTEDPLMPYHGGWGAMRKPKTTGDPEGKLLPVEDVAQLLVEANGIQATPVVSTLGNADPKDGCSNEVRTWTDASTGARVVLVKVIGGGHVVPGGRQYLPKAWIGPACQDFDHVEVMWRFFQEAK